MDLPLRLYQPVFEIPERLQGAIESHARMLRSLAHPLTTHQVGVSLDVGAALAVYL